MLSAEDNDHLDGMNLWPQLVGSTFAELHAADRDGPDSNRKFGAEATTQSWQRDEVLYNIDPIGLPPPVSHQHNFDSFVQF